MGSIFAKLTKKDIDKVLKNQGTERKKYTFEELGIHGDFLERETYLNKITVKYDVKWEDWEEGIECPDGIKGCEVCHAIIKGVVFYKDRMYEGGYNHSRFSGYT